MTHTSGTALRMCVCMFACLWPYTVNFKWAYLNISWRQDVLGGSCHAQPAVGKGLPARQQCRRERSFCIAGTPMVCCYGNNTADWSVWVLKCIISYWSPYTSIIGSSGGKHCHGNRNICLLWIAGKGKLVGVSKFHYWGKCIVPLAVRLDVQCFLCMTCVIT